MTNPQKYNLTYWPSQKHKPIFFCTCQNDNIAAFVWQTHMNRSLHAKLVNLTDSWLCGLAPAWGELIFLLLCSTAKTHWINDGCCKQHRTAQGPDQRDGISLIDSRTQHNDLTGFTVLKWCGVW